MILKSCSMNDPSWSELHNFLSFLNKQLIHCKESAFYQMDSGKKGDTLPAFREFVVNFMIHMSRDFATRSLVIAEETPEAYVEPERAADHTDTVSSYRMKRTWEASPHPYLFFNADKQSMTFLGFMLRLRNPHDPFELASAIDPHDPTKILMPNIMGSRLYKALLDNRVIFNLNYDDMRKNEKIEVLARVMGIPGAFHKDENTGQEVPHL